MIYWQRRLSCLVGLHHHLLNTPDGVLGLRGRTVEGPDARPDARGRSCVGFPPTALDPTGRCPDQPHYHEQDDPYLTWITWIPGHDEIGRVCQRGLQDRIETDRQIRAQAVEQAASPKPIVAQLSEDATARVWFNQGAWADPKVNGLPGASWAWAPTRWIRLAEGTPEQCLEFVEKNRKGAGAPAAYYEVLTMEGRRLKTREESESELTRATQRALELEARQQDLQARQDASASQEAQEKPVGLPGPVEPLIVPGAPGEKPVLPPGHLGPSPSKLRRIEENRKRLGDWPVGKELVTLSRNEWMRIWLAVRTLRDSSFPTYLTSEELSKFERIWWELGVMREAERLERLETAPLPPNFSRCPEGVHSHPGAGQDDFNAMPGPDPETGWTCPAGWGKRPVGKPWRVAGEAVSAQPVTALRARIIADEGVPSGWVTIGKPLTLEEAARAEALSPGEVAAAQVRWVEMTRAEADREHARQEKGLGGRWDWDDGLEAKLRIIEEAIESPAGQRALGAVIRRLKKEFKDE
jgi:hypothetical protein